MLRVYLGAAPGVGKTFAMLEEGRALSARGEEVVVGLVETHGRAETAALLIGLEVLPRRRAVHRSIALTELDVDSLLARKPRWALIDELAHSNAPGSANVKRWQDIDLLLEAGVNVISTVNIQHVESLGSVVREITGVAQREVIPDLVLRAADQIELVDLAPEALRTRLNAGQVYPATTVDAALSNYFRLGNLTALRELALLWLADEVDDALQEYRRDHGIDDRWQARERIVVALPGGAEGEAIVRRGAQIASRSRGSRLLAVHVSSPDGLTEPDPGALLSQRSLVEGLGGSYHQIVGESTTTAIIEFLRSAEATQLVIGVGRRRTSFLTGPDIGRTLADASGDIDIHLVSHRHSTGLPLPRSRGSLSLRRLVLGFITAIVGLPLLTLLLSLGDNSDSLVVDVLVFQLVVVVVSLIGGLWPAVVAAVLAGLMLDYFFIDPLYSIAIADPTHLLTLLIFLVVAVLVSTVVDAAASRSRAARRSAAEAETLATVAGSIIRGEDALEALTDRLREAFRITSVSVSYRGAIVIEPARPRPGRIGDDEVRTVLSFGTDGEVVLVGRPLLPGDRRVVDAFVAQIEGALLQGELRTTAAAILPLEEADRARTALLAAVGHDLRTPLSAATAAVSSLRSTDISWTERDRTELLDTAEVSLRRLADLVDDLLDASRLQAGVLPISLAVTGFDEIVPLALDELGIDGDGVRVDLPPELPAVIADPVLVQRVLSNLIANAIRYSPAASPPLVAASSFGERVELRIIDRGPGIPPEKLAAAFEPFQRLGDTDNRTGVGLGLALSTGFMDAMGGSLDAEETPGGGLTMVLTLPIAPTVGVPRNARET